MARFRSGVASQGRRIARRRKRASRRTLSAMRAVSGSRRR